MNKTDTLHARMMEPVSPPPLNLEFKSSKGSECGVVAAAALTLGILEHGKAVEINYLHVSLAHAHTEGLKQTAKQHVVRLTVELLSCSACARAKVKRTCTSHRTTGRATISLGLGDIDTAGSYPTSLGGSRYVAIFVDSASRLQRPYGSREKSASAILAVVKCFVADMGIPRVFRTHNGSTRMGCLWTIVTVSGSGASSPHDVPHSRTGPSRATSPGHLRLGMRHAGTSL